MAKRAVKDKEVIDYLKDEGFAEINAKEKATKWYDKASRKQSCLKVEQKKKIRSS
jgi:hypothetical protein